MIAAIASIRRNVEPGALPKRVWFYGLRREIAAWAPARALAMGFALGIIAAAAVTVAVWIA